MWPGANLRCRGNRHWDTEHGSHAGTDHVRVGHVGRGIRDQDAARPGGIRAAQRSARPSGRSRSPTTSPTTRTPSPRGRCRGAWEKGPGSIPSTSSCTSDHVTVARTSSRHKNSPLAGRLQRASSHEGGVFFWLMRRRPVTLAGLLKLFVGDAERVEFRIPHPEAQLNAPRDLVHL